VIPKLGPVNYEFFGGKAEYDKMLRVAKAHEGETEQDTDTNAFNVEVYRLNTKVAARMNQGLTNEVDYKDLLSACDNLVAKYEPQDKEAAAQVLVTKAKLYCEVFGDAGKGKQAIVQLKQDFGQTELGKSADEILESIEKEEKAKKVRSALAEGTAFPEFDEKDMAGKPLSLAQRKGKVVLIDFWATWCGPCVAELPNVRNIYEEQHGQGFEIIGVSLDEERERLEAFIKKEKITWPQYFDGQGWKNKLAVKYAIESIPATFLLDGTGKIIGTDLRGNALEEAVREALKSK
jgi:thiol-disulfide isomerase/thioredoxin